MRELYVLASGHNRESGARMTAHGHLATITDTINAADEHVCRALDFCGHEKPAEAQIELLRTREHLIELMRQSTKLREAIEQLELFQ